MLKQLSKYSDVGLLLLRIGLGLAMVMHGQGKMFDYEKWAGLGEAGVSPLGIHFGYPVWGFLAALSEFGGGILLIIGFAFRPACIFLLLTMVGATATHLEDGGGLFGKASHAFELGCVFLALIFVGPGKYSADRG